MIIHMWMHWFWITISALECFLFFTVQMISLTCISHPLMSEAGLLDNNISTHFDFEKLNISSQIGGEGENITTVLHEEANVTSGEVISEAPTVSPITEGPVENLTSDVGPEPRSDEHVFLEESSDSKDTYNGDGLEVFQYPLKKVAKYSQIKHGKKTKEDSKEEEEKSETVNVIEEKVKINISLQEDVGEKNESSESSEQGTSTSTIEPVVTEAEAAPVTAAVSVENVTLNEVNATIPAASEEPAETAMASSPSSQPGTNTARIAEVTEDPKEANLKNETLVIENKVEESMIHTTVEPFIIQNRVAAATSAHNFENDQAKLNAGSITGITLGILVIFSLFGAVSFVLYRRRYLNKPQVLHDKCSNLDSSGYIDDTSLREHSEEMYSLDNDSFLNSLEAMTIQNYWTENVKHTKL